MGERIVLDDQFLIDAGYEHLNAEQAKLALEAIYDALELRVGRELTKDLSDAQLRKFEELVDSNDEAATLQWMETNRKNYRDVVRAEMETVLRRVRAARAIRADEIAMLAPEGTQTDV
ncbi:DUF5663 domain-containing protein [Microbacterium sp. IEGM 1404]|uniref:DUF5663 domain-containing protein n=1 Tax=Microbacterium sp. IEGM 1404 TaxID=3047084 RepID=UPI0024B6A3B7|nr:DUF5663 domain-containing protein [Microbacterium sp. IEGM 1404]MDI9892520.1 DUF5663 domain-containing protein [Microbacterium sp. IEGM 1404]